MKGDPFETLEAIELKICDSSKVKCPFVTMFAQLEHLVMTKQDDNKGIVDHAKQFKHQ